MNKRLLKGGKKQNRKISAVTELLLLLPEIVEAGFREKILLLEGRRLPVMEAGRSEHGRLTQKSLARALVVRRLGRTQAREGQRRLREACGLGAAETDAEHGWVQSLQGHGALLKRLVDEAGALRAGEHGGRSRQVDAESRHDQGAAGWRRRSDRTRACA